MSIIMKGLTPAGISVQIEDWSESYPCICRKNSTIGFYPVAQNSIYYEKRPDLPPYPMKGKSFRASLDFNNEEDAKQAFDDLCAGKKKFTDFMDYYSSNVIPENDFLKAIAE